MYGFSRSDYSRWGGSTWRRPYSIYGPATSRDWLSRYYRDRNIWRYLNRDSIYGGEEANRARERLEENNRITEEEAARSPVLSVESLNLHISDNAWKHHTNNFRWARYKGQLIVRRGQEFTVTVTFDRPYRKDKDDLHFILVADIEEKPWEEKIQKTFKLDEDGTAEYKQTGEWGASIVNIDRTKMTIAMYIPANCAVGDWDLKIRTKLQGSDNVMDYVHPQTVIVLFNPWSPRDQVHFTEDKGLLDEYINNNVGSTFYGVATSIGSATWTFAQFDNEILDICLSLLRRSFEFKMTPEMGDAITVSRNLSSVVNANDDSGVIIGRWSPPYSGGERPTEWTSSATILRQFARSGPVKYGQCWVFANVLTTVCRALGLPCRCITNFESAHDTDYTCTIDYYFSEDGTKEFSADSVWNFHVWNEVWILRPDYPGNIYDGWHVIDATPQEESQDKMQCGPCPVKAVKRGDINVGFDTPFVFGEVNADIIHWVRLPQGDKVTKILKKAIGRNMSTKFPDGRAPIRNLSPYDTDDRGIRKDVTSEYKYDEGSAEERAAVNRAVKYARHDSSLLSVTEDLQVTFDTERQTEVGKDLVLTVFVTNTTRDDVQVETIMAARSTKYWDSGRGDQQVLKQTFRTRTVRARRTETFQATVPSETYLQACDENLIIHAFAFVRELKYRMPYTANSSFRLLVPELQVAGPRQARYGQPITMKVTITNPLVVPLTNCYLSMEGDLQQDDSDRNAFSGNPSGRSKMRLRDLRPHASTLVSVRLVGKMESDDDDKTKIMNVVFDCTELLSGMKGSYTVHLRPY